MSHPPLHVFVGDVHAGSKTAVMQPFTDDDGVTHSPSRVQAALLDFWRAALAEVKRRARGHTVAVHLGGDLVDGVAHHGSVQTLGDENDQRALAVALLQPYANLAGRLYALKGTDAHVGQSGREDKSVAKELGAKADYHWRLDCAGRLLDWAHHAGLGGKPWTEEAPLAALAKEIYFEHLERGERERVPSLVVRHHVHRPCRAHAKGIDVVTVPGWQAQTTYTRGRWPHKLLTVGLLLWYPASGEIVPLLYDFPADPIVTVNYG